MEVSRDNEFIKVLVTMITQWRRKIVLVFGIQACGYWEMTGWNNKNLGTMTDFMKPHKMNYFGDGK